MKERAPETQEILGMPMRRDAATSLWSQVKSRLTSHIRDNGLAEHSKLPSESELCAKFSVSRTVVREAMAQLVNEGIIYRLQGKGAFVAGRREQQDFVGTSVGFSGELADQHKEVTRRILRQEIAKPTARMAKLMRLDASTNMVFIDRVQMVQSLPRMIVRWAMVESFVPGLQDLPMQNRSLYETIGRQYGVRLVMADRWVEAVTADPVDSELLNVPIGTPMLAIESVAENAAGQAIEYYTARYLTNRSRLHFAVRMAS